MAQMTSCYAAGVQACLKWWKAVIRFHHVHGNFLRRLEAVHPSPFMHTISRQEKRPSPNMLRLNDWPALSVPSATDPTLGEQFSRLAPSFLQVARFLHYLSYSRYFW